jgi:UDP-N-acetylglucosamine 2-epimerase
VFPVHPRTRKAIEAVGWRPAPHVHVIEPVGYREMIELQRDARLILTDSGGMQKEAYALGVPCAILRAETEWVEIIDAGWAVLADADRERIRTAVRTLHPAMERPPLHGDGHAAERCVMHLEHAMTVSTR